MRHAPSPEIHDARLGSQLRRFSIAMSVALLCEGLVYAALGASRGVSFELLLARGFLPALLGALSTLWFFRNHFLPTEPRTG